MFNFAVVDAETGDGSVSDFFNPAETIEQDDSETINEEIDTPNSPLINQSNELTLFGLIVRIIVVLAIIIGLIYLLLKFFNRSGNFNKQGEVLTNLGGISLGINKSAQMLKVGNKIYLVGVGDDISILTEITDSVVIEQLLEKQQAPSMNATSLLDQFNSFFKKTKSKEEPVQKEQIFKNQDFASLFKGELDTMKDKREKIRDKYKEEE